VKYDKKDKAKVVILAVLLAGLWIFIGVRFAILSQQTKSKIQADRERHAAAHAAQIKVNGGLHSVPEKSPVLRLAALMTPVEPPKDDPFRPVIPPRSHTSAAQPPATPKKDPSESLPPLWGDSSSSSRRSRNELHVTGIIQGSPSTAILRFGENHYVVREGDMLDNDLRILEIGRNSVTLRDGQSTYVLRIGQ